MTNLRSFITNRSLFLYDAEKWYLTKYGFKSADKLNLTDKILAYDCKKNKLVYDKILDIGKSQFSFIYFTNHYVQATSSLEPPIFLKKDLSIKDPIYDKKDRKRFGDSILKDVNYIGNYFLRVNTSKINCNYGYINTNNNLVLLLGLIYFFKFKNSIIIDRRLYLELKHIINIIGTRKETTRVDDVTFIRFLLKKDYNTDFYEKLDTSIKKKVLSIIYNNDYRMLMKVSHYQMRAIGITEEDKQYMFKRTNRAIYTENQIVSIDMQKVSDDDDIIIKGRATNFLEVQSRYISNRVYPITYLPHFIFPLGIMALSDIKAHDTQAYYNKIIDLHRS